MEENIREERTKIMRKYVVGCVHAVVGKKKLLVQFIYGQKIYMSCVSLSYLRSKEEVCLDMDDKISNLPKK